jgi:hypothetical protein
VCRPNRSGFNLLFYGFGSKLSLLTEFGQTMLSAYPLMTVEGYSPTTTVRNVRMTYVYQRCPFACLCAPSQHDSLPTVRRAAPVQLLVMITQSVLGVTHSMPAEPMDHCRALQALFLNEARLLQQCQKNRTAHSLGGRLRV